MRVREYAIVGLVTLLNAAAAAAQGPWTVTVAPHQDPVAIGTCSQVSIKAFDPVVKGTPRNEAGHYVSTAADFDMKVESSDKAAVVGKYESTSIWSACVCQAATVGSRATITATYPAQALPEKLRVPGVAMQATGSFTIGKGSGSAYNPAGCDALKASASAIVRAGGATPLGVKTPVSTTAGGAAAGGAASGGAASGAAAGGAAGSGTASGSATTGGAAVGGKVVGGTVAGGAAAGSATSGGATTGGAAAGGAAGSAAGGGAAGGAASGAAGGGSTTGSSSAGIAAGGATAGGAAGAGAGGAAASAGGAPIGTATAGPARGGSTLTAAPALAGPAPTNVRVVAGGSPLIQQLVWDRPTENTGYQVSFKMNASVSSWTLMTPTPIKSETYSDSSFRQPGVMYRVTALYADGRQGSTDYVYSNPPPLKVPASLKAVEVSQGKVRLTWPSLANVTAYRIMGTGRPADGTSVKGLHPYDGEEELFEISNLPAGTYTWQVTADYGGAYQTAGLPTATITILSSRFRVSILGFKVLQETNDDLLSRDGKHNEVYAAALVCEGIQPKYVTDPGGQTTHFQAFPPECSVVRSAVHGDVSGFPTRIKAGSGSPTGGIATGDLIGPGPTGTTAGSTTTFPLLLWEGQLLRENEAVWIAPSLWESGGSDEDMVWWGIQVKNALRLARENYEPAAGTASALGGGFVPKNPPYTPICGGDKGNDRPIGLVPNSDTGVPGLICWVIGLTREKADAVLAGPPQEPGKPAGVLTMDLVDAVSGHYLMYIKLERVPPTS